MSHYPSPVSQLLWKFVATEWYGAIWWRWEIWTQAGQFVARSQTQFDTLTECELDAKSNGYIAPEQKET
jgi:hypothetical protein